MKRSFEKVVDEFSDRIIQLKAKLQEKVVARRKFCDQGKRNR
jgi:hypothetical protein